MQSPSRASEKLLKLSINSCHSMKLHVRHPHQSSPRPPSHFVSISSISVPSPGQTRTCYRYRRQPCLRKVYGGRGVTAPFFLNLNTWGRWAVSLKPRWLYPVPTDVHSVTVCSNTDLYCNHSYTDHNHMFRPSPVGIANFVMFIKVTEILDKISCSLTDCCPVARTAVWLTALRWHELQFCTFCNGQWRTQDFFLGGGQQIQLRTERTGIWGW